MIPVSVSDTSQNWNTNTQSTNDGTDRLLSADIWVTQLTKEAKDFVSKATKKIELGDVSVSRSTDTFTFVYSNNLVTACMQYVQRLAGRVASLNPEELRAIMDDITSNAPNQLVYNIMMGLCGNAVDKELVS
jgi:hypothetical protein